MLSERRGWLPTTKYSQFLRRDAMAYICRISVLRAISILFILLYFMHEPQHFNLPS